MREARYTATSPGVRIATRVLVADPNASERTSLAAGLAGGGYEVREADSGEAVLALLKSESFSVLICDQWLHGMNGTQVVSTALRLDPDLAIVMLSDLNDAATAARALSSGAYDYLSRPTTVESVGKAIERALHRRAGEIERRQVERAVRETVIMRTVEIERERAALRNLSLEIVHSLVKVLEAKDPCLRGHSERVAALSARMAEEMRLSPGEVERVRLAAKLHDVGMVGVPEQVLNKAASLTDAEYALVKSHVEIGLTILAPVAFIGDALTYVRDHHEHFDGGGYPRGLFGTAISVGGRIIAAADAFDALTSARPFRAAFSTPDTLEILGRKSGKLLDPEVYAALTRVVGVRRRFGLI